MLPTSSARIRFAAIFLALLGAPRAQADMPHINCRYPMVYYDASVNVVVLPYTYAGANRSLTNLGNRLALLVKFDVLSHILGYGSVGAVQMELPEGSSPNDRCGPDTVLPILLGNPNPNMQPSAAYTQFPEVRSALHPGRGLVIVWGLLYEEGDDIFVQTFARFLRRDVDETVAFQVGGLPFTARPSSQYLAFTPQKFTRADLEQVEDSYKTADVVHDQPDDASPGNELPIFTRCTGNDCAESAVHAAYYVNEKRGEWIHIQYINPMQGGRKAGWIHSVGSISGKPLDTILPELRFLEGATGYLALRVSDAEKTTLPPGAGSLAVDQLYNFLRSTEGQPPDSTTATAIELEGLLEYFMGNTRIDALAKASDYFERARVILPYDPNAITLAVVAQAGLEWRQAGHCERTIQKSDRLSSALAFRSNSAALDNLSNFYKLVEKAPPPPSKIAVPTLHPPASLDELDEAAAAARLKALQAIKVPM